MAARFVEGATDFRLNWAGAIFRPQFQARACWEMTTKIVLESIGCASNFKVSSPTGPLKVVNQAVSLELDWSGKTLMITNGVDTVVCMEDGVTVYSLLLYAPEDHKVNDWTAEDAKASFEFGERSLVDKPVAVPAGEYRLRMHAKMADGVTHSLTVCFPDPDLVVDWFSPASRVVSIRPAGQFDLFVKRARLYSNTRAFAVATIHT